MPPTIPDRVVVALGGNAISRPGEDGSVRQDYINLRQSLDAIVHLIDLGKQVVLTHGNGPQVGNQMIRVELARGQAPDLPLDVMVADLQGGMGYMIERVLRNKLLAHGIEKPVCALLTLVEVAANDPAMENPSKFVGSILQQEEVAALTRERGWVVKEDPGRGWRRVVPSPRPISIIEQALIGTLIDSGALVIVSGGGGIPVARRPGGSLVGVEAVIDKDLAAAVLAHALGAPELYILTGVERVTLNYGQPEEKPLPTMTLNQARQYAKEGHFPAGSMGPKVEAACHFLELGGEKVLITDTFTLQAALAGSTGTWVIP